jgi:hypothetical protein
LLIKVQKLTTPEWPGSEPRRHHIVPKVILKGFADQRKRIRVVPTHGGSAEIEHIKRVAVIRDANTLRTDGGLDFDLEELLSKAENEFPNVIECLDLASRTEEQDRAIFGLIAVQFARDPYHRAWLGEEVDVIRAALVTALREDNPSISDDEIAGEFEHYGKRHIVKSHLIPDAENVAIAGTPFLMGRVFEDMQTLNLTVLRSAGPMFITCDSPVALFDRYEIAERRDAEAERAGFLPETEITHPITSRHAALVTSRATPSALINVGADVVAIVNARTVRTAAREVYCNPKYPLQSLEIDLSRWWWRRPILDTL